MIAPVPDQVRPRPGLTRKLRRRIPLRIRHYWKLLAVCLAFAVVLSVVFGSARIRPYVTSASDESGSAVSVNIAGDRELFDPAVAHTVELTFRDADYERMLDAFFDNGEKEYVEADLTIDGVMVPSVGIRLKGNSTLSGLTRDGQTRARTAGEGGPGGGEPPAGAEFRRAPQGGAPVDGAAPGGGQQRRVGGPGGAGLAAEEPETLPWLISFDEFVEGRRYQGHQEIAVRVGGMGGGSSVLNEALALSLLDTSGERTQRYAYSSFTVNDRPATARLLVEHPDENYADEMDSTGVLYKSRSTSQFTDQGDDPIDYQDDFKQINLTGSQDLQPVIDLIKWVNEADDEEFDARLAEHVDVEQFARYVATQNLLLNFDDMAGPGRNYYLWYDLATRKFSVVSWDHNLTFSGSADQGPHDEGRMGGPGGGIRLAPGGEAQQAAPAEGSQQPEGFAPPEGFQMPEGAQPGASDGAQPDGGQRQGGMRAGHLLKERFLASDAFTAVHEAAYRELYQEMYGSGRALAAIDEITAVLATVDGYDAAAVTADADQLRTLVQQRTESLRDNEVITGT
nr:CotH kinase family protein [Micromonospora sp. DSM 115978]